MVTTPPTIPIPNNIAMVIVLVIGNLVLIGLLNWIIGDCKVNCEWYWLMYAIIPANAIPLGLLIPRQH